MHERLISVTVNGTARRHSRSPQDARRLSCARTARSPARTSAASTACAARARCSLDGEAVRACLHVRGAGRRRRGHHGRGPRAARRQPQRRPGRRSATCHGLQCGFCTPGFVVSITALLARHPEPDDDEIRDGLSGNLCRCTGYQGIINAVRTRAARREPAMTATADCTATAGSALRRPAVQRREDARLAHRARHLRRRRRRCPGMLHAAFVRSDVARGTIARHRRRRGARRCPASSPCSPPPTSTATSARAWPTTSGPAPADRPFRLLADGDVRFVGEPIAHRRRRDAVRRRGRVRARSSSTSSRATPIVDHDGRARRRRRLVHPERRRPTSSAQIPRAPTTPSWTPSSHRPRTSSPRRSTSTATLRADGDPRHRRALGRRARRARPSWISTQGPHECAASSLAPLGIPEHQVRVVMGDVGGGFGQKMFMIREEIAVVLAAQAPRPAGQVDRGPAREPHRRPPRPRRQHDRQLRRRRRRPHPRRAGRPRRGRRRLRRRGGSSAIGFVGMLFPGPVPDPAARLLGARPSTPTPAARCAYRGPWMMETSRASR